MSNTVAKSINHVSINLVLLSLLLTLSRHFSTEWIGIYKVRPLQWDLFEGYYTEYLWTPASANVTSSNQDNIYLFEVNNRNTRKKCKICPKLRQKTLERPHWPRSGVLVVNFEHISHLFLVFLLCILNRQILAGKCKQDKDVFETLVKFNDKAFLQKTVNF